VAATAAGADDTHPLDNSSTFTTTLTPNAHLVIAKSGPAGAVPGQAEPIGYTITLHNNGPSDVQDVPLNDTFPAVLSEVTWACTAGSGSACTALGTGDIHDLVDLQAGATVTYTVSGKLASAATGSLVNTASFSLPEGVIDPTPGSTSSTATTPLTPSVGLALSKSSTPNPGLAPGESITYRIVARNSGPSDALNAGLADSFPTQLENITWSCAASSGSTCSATGSGDIADTVTVRAGGRITYTVSANVKAGVAAGTVITNAATFSFGAAQVTANDANTVLAVSATAVKDALSGAGASSRSLPFIDANGDGAISPGDTLKYQVTLTSSTSASTAGYSDTLDPHTSLVVGSVTCGTGCVVTQGNTSGDTMVQVSYTGLTANVPVIITYRATVNAGLPFQLAGLSNQGTATINDEYTIVTEDAVLQQPGSPTVVSLGRGTLSGLTWRDFDDDGARSGGEPVLAGALVTLNYKGGDQTWGTADDEALSTYSDAAGAYSFSGLLAAGTGMYRVSFTQAAGFELGPQGTDSLGDPTDGLTAGQTVQANQATTGVSQGYVSRMDFGNLPAPYGYTSLEQDGARHLYQAGAPRLGATVTTENDSSASTPDDNDGVERANTTGWSAGGTQNLTVSASGAGQLWGWFDWNNDGDFGDPGEAVNLGSLSSGSQSVPLTVGSSYVVNHELYARFRLYPTGYSGSYLPFGLVDGGEVEDYYWTFSSTAVTLAELAASEQVEGGLLVRWETGVEIDCLGFNLYRAETPGGPYRRLNADLIPTAGGPGTAGAGGVTGGSVYTWSDLSAQPGQTYYYKLEVVNLDGAPEWYGPLPVSLAPPLPPQVEIY
ncbi:MAG: GEVED domain-containing protein, partial [Chloroflexota bacterium]